jgi:hypothetical protein
MTPPTRTWLKQFVEISTFTFLGLGISRLAFPKHCRGCQCEGSDSSKGPGIDQSELPNKSLQQKAQPDAQSS